MWREWRTDPGNRKKRGKQAGGMGGLIYLCAHVIKQWPRNSSLICQGLQPCAAGLDRVSRGELAGSTPVTMKELAEANQTSNKRNCVVRYDLIGLVTRLLTRQGPWKRGDRRMVALDRAGRS